MQKGERQHETKLITLNYASVLQRDKKANAKKEIMFEQVHIKRNENHRKSFKEVTELKQ